MRIKYTTTPHRHFNQTMWLDGGENRAPTWQGILVLCADWNLETEPKPYCFAWKSTIDLHYILERAGEFIKMSLIGWFLSNKTKINLCTVINDFYVLTESMFDTHCFFVVKMILECLVNNITTFLTQEVLTVLTSVFQLI